MSTSVPSKIYETNLPDIQAMCLEIISGLWSVLQEELIEEVELFRFFLHGTNMAPFIKHQFDPRIRFPYTLSSDFDCELVINPILDKKYYKGAYSENHSELLDLVFQYLIAAVKDPKYWHLVTSSASLFSDYPIYKYDTYTRFNLRTKDIYNTIPKDSPFYVYKVNDFYIKDRGPTYISQVKFGIRIPNPNSHPGYPYKMIELIDVSIPKQENPHITHLWNITNTGLEVYKEDIEIEGIPISVEFPALL